MKTAEEVILSVLEKELGFLAEGKLKSTARALVDRLGMWNVEFLDTAHNTMTVIKPKETIDEYRAKLAQTMQEEEQKLITKRPVSEDEQERFKALVLFLAETIYRAPEEICEEVYYFEEAIGRSGNGKAHFDAAWEDYERINFSQNKIHRHSPRARFFADYDDGYLNVCEWRDDFEKLEELLKQISPILYDMYQDRLREERGEKSHEDYSI